LIVRLKSTNLTTNLSKSEFRQFKVTYICHVIGYGQVIPINAKIKHVIDIIHSVNNNYPFDISKEQK